MATPPDSARIGQIIAGGSERILSAWLQQQHTQNRSTRGVIKEAQLREESARFLSLLGQAAQGGQTDIETSRWDEVRAMLQDLSRSRTEQGFLPTETATFVFSLKRPLFDSLRERLASEPQLLAEETWAISQLLDALGLYTTEVALTNREEVIRRQQQEMLELSTPVTRLWEGILAVPLIGTLDSARTQVIMENLLQQIVDSTASIAIIDITGVPTVDTLVAQHLLKTVSAARLMGAECIISGIRPQIAQTIVHLGVALGDVTTKASLADALELALRRRGLAIARAGQTRAP